jgi:hypothetical protein
MPGLTMESNDERCREPTRIYLDQGQFSVMTRVLNRSSRSRRVLNFLFHFPVWTVPAPSASFLPLIVLTSNVDVAVFEGNKCTMLYFAYMLGAGLSPRGKFIYCRSWAGQSFVKKRLRRGIVSGARSK